MASSESIEKIYDHTDDQPNAETHPGYPWKAKHQIETRKNSENRDQRNERCAESPWPPRIPFAQDQNTYAHENECKQCPDIRQVHHLIDACNHRCDPDGGAGQNCGHIGSPIPGVDFCKALGKQPIPRHREEDPRLAELENEKHRGMRDNGAECHDADE